MADTADGHLVAEGASKPRCVTPWPGKNRSECAGPVAEVSRANPTSQDTEQEITSRTTHDTSVGYSAATTGMRRGQKTTGLAHGDKDVLSCGRATSLESVVLSKASPRNVGGTEMLRLPLEKFNGQAKELYEGGESGALHGRSANPSLPKRVGGVVRAPKQHRKSVLRKPRSPQRPNQEGIREQMIARSTDMLTAMPTDSEGPTRNAVWCKTADEEVEQNTTADASHPEIGPACTPATLCATGSFQATSTLLLSQSQTPARDLDPNNSNVTKLAELGGRVDCGPHSCERHGLVACTLCGGTCASGPRRSSGVGGGGEIGPPPDGATPVIGGTVIPFSAVAMSGNTGHIAGRTSDCRLSNAVQSVPSHEVGEDQIHLARNTDILQDEQQTKSGSLQTTTGKGENTGLAPGKPCDRHLLLDCILCKMLSPTAFGGGVSPNVLGGVSHSSHGGVSHLQGKLGRSTSLPALGAISQRENDGGGSDTRDETAAAAFAIGARDRHTVRGLSMNRCERHDLLGCFLCGLGKANSRTPGGGSSKSVFRTKEAALSPPSRSFVHQTSQNSTGTTPGSGLAPPEEGFSDAGKYSVPCDDQLTFHSDGVNSSKSTENGLSVPGCTKHLRESPNGTNQAGDDGEGTAGTKAMELPVGRSSDTVDIVRRARRHRSRGGTPHRRRISKPPNSVRNDRRSWYNSSLSLLDSNSSSRDFSAGLSPRASNVVGTTAGARGSAQANTVVSATRAREKGVDRKFTARAITAALAVLK